MQSLILGGKINELNKKFCLQIIFNHYKSTLNYIKLKERSNMENEQMITFTELCDYLKTTKPTALKMIKNGLPHYTLNNDYRFKKSEVDHHLKGKKYAKTN